MFHISAPESFQFLFLFPLIKAVTMLDFRGEGNKRSARRRTFGQQLPPLSWLERQGHVATVVANLDPESEVIGRLESRVACDYMLTRPSSCRAGYGLLRMARVHEEANHTTETL